MSSPSKAQGPFWKGWEDGKNGGAGGRGGILYGIILSQNTTPPHQLSCVPLQTITTAGLGDCWGLPASLREGVRGRVFRPHLEYLLPTVCKSAPIAGGLKFWGRARAHRREKTPPPQRWGIIIQIGCRPSSVAVVRSPGLCPYHLTHYSTRKQNKNISSPE